MTSRHDDDRFDEAMRALHRHSLSHLRPDTLQRLRVARASAKCAPERRFAWPLASAGVAVFMLAVALPLLRPPAPSATDGPDAQTPRADAPVIATPPHASATHPPEGEPVMLTALAESPDFYLWLASNDAGLAALE